MTIRKTTAGARFAKAITTSLQSAVDLELLTRCLAGRGAPEDLLLCLRKVYDENLRLQAALDSTPQRLEASARLEALATVKAEQKALARATTAAFEKDYRTLQSVMQRYLNKLTHVSQASEEELISLFKLNVRPEMHCRFESVLKGFRRALRKKFPA